MNANQFYGLGNLKNCPCSSTPIYKDIQAPWICFSLLCYFWRLANLSVAQRWHKSPLPGQPLQRILRSSTGFSSEELCDQLAMSVTANGMGTIISNANFPSPCRKTRKSYTGTGRRYVLLTFIEHHCSHAPRDVMGLMLTQKYTARHVHPTNTDNSSNENTKCSYTPAPSNWGIYKAN